MASYEYGCEGCGPFTLRAPIGTAAQQAACPACGGEARRVFSAPMVRQMPSALSRAVRRGEATASTPAVVDRVPPRGGRGPAAPSPALGGLPRR